jgi:hypothetical protein
VALESLIPWKTEVPSRFIDVINEPVCSFGTSDFSFWNCPAWPPSIGGILLGALQLPAVMLIGNVLGSATAFQIGSCAWLLPLPSDLQDSGGWDDDKNEIEDDLVLDRNLFLCQFISRHLVAPAPPYI